MPIYHTENGGLKVRKLLRLYTWCLASGKDSDPGLPGQYSPHILLIGKHDFLSLYLNLIPIGGSTRKIVTSCFQSGIKSFFGFFLMCSPVL